MKNQKIEQGQKLQVESQDRFDFWRDHSEAFLEMALRGQYRERIQHPDAYGKRKGGCGDTVEFFLMVREGFIDIITYDIDGCINTNACANAIVEMARRKSLEEAWKIRPEDIEEFLKTLPPSHKHCAELAAGALYMALANYRELKSSPWKKMYSAK